ncbi:hypothetical protein [Bacillus benzoevorans]|uniref:Uncharacterized protein n=1 Tax=Bacillus benzoevorans TaxID=1456 RepID=A0A7X0LYN2_9BACI|nr:hypothetical protein [Bacillus benzoevorans]MBB6447614.1 hypothetical protein [Bacillus benzoevorans]
MNRTEKDQVNYIADLQNEVFTKNMKAMHPQSRETLIAEISAMEKNKNADETVKQYLKWVLKQTEINFYLAILPQGRGLILFKQNLKAAIVLGLNRPHEEVKSFFPGHDFILEILNIHSMQKGEGYKIMNKVIDLAKQLNSPICLWTESEENVHYFERYGFKNHGKLDGSDQWMMVY